MVARAGEDRGSREESLSEESPLLGPRRKSTIGKSTGENSATSDTNSRIGIEGVKFLADVSQARFWIIFLQILSSLFIGSFDGTIMASSHPMVTSYFSAANSASWLSTAFMLTSTTFQPLLGRLSDAVGRKPMYMGCMVVFVLATTLCALAGSIEVFIFARALCGLGAGGTTALGSIIISDLVPIQRRSVYQSYINATFGLSSALGAALGGTMAERLGWRWEFGIQVPPLLGCLCVAAVAMPGDLGLGQAERRTSVRRALRDFDLKGSLLLTSSVSSLVLGLNLGGNVLPWKHAVVITALGFFAVCFPLFLLVESWASKPIMPLQLISCAPRANIVFSAFLGALLSNSIFFNLPLYFQAVLLTSATSSGLRLALPSLISCVAGASTGIAMNRTGRLKWPLVCGTACWLLGSACLHSLQRGLPSVLHYVILIPSALGQGFQVPGTFMATLACSSQSEQAIVISTLILWRSLGTVLGVAMSSLVVQNALVHYLASYVAGPDKDRVVALVRSSVEAVANLEQPYREQVVQSYEAALKLLFACCIGLATISVLLIIPVKLPRLAGKQ
ncbi:hypothetical protein RJ55_01747 [Drechmeria coniospora]|nr:hypothetical protein RJ55_01747 [Drechmeria coniospora]